MNQVSLSNTDNLRELPAIYIIKNNVNGKLYVGETMNLNDRMRLHLVGKRQIIHKAIRKYGANQFTLAYTYCPNLDKETLLDLEECLIDRMNALVPNGYNLCKRGQSSIGRVLTEEARKNMGLGQVKRYENGGMHPRLGKIFTQNSKDKISNSHKENFKNGYIHPMTGRNHSQQSKDKMSLSKSGESNYWYGKCGSEIPHSKPVDQYTKSGKFIKTYSNAREASIETKSDYRSISKVCNNVRKSAGGFIWKFNDMKGIN